MSADFTYVSRTKKPRKNKLRLPPSPSIDSLNEQLDSIKSTFLASQYRGRCLDELRKALGNLACPERIICLGLGSLVDGEAPARKISHVQLALLLDLRDLIGVPAVAYDPVFTALDIEFLELLGIEVKCLDEDDNNYASSRTLLYLPHCDRSTNEAVVSNLLSTSSLGNAILLGNDLRNYANVLTDTRFESVAPAIFSIVNDQMMEWISLEPNKEEAYWDAFSDLCLMWHRNRETPLSNSRQSM